MFNQTGGVCHSKALHRCLGYKTVLDGKRRTAKHLRIFASKLFKLRPAFAEGDNFPVSIEKIQSFHQNLLEEKRANVNTKNSHKNIFWLLTSTMGICLATTSGKSQDWDSSKPINKPALLIIIHTPEPHDNHDMQIPTSDLRQLMTKICQVTKDLNGFYSPQFRIILEDFNCT